MAQGQDVDSDLSSNLWEAGETQAPSKTPALPGASGRWGGAAVGTARQQEPGDQPAARGKAPRPTPPPPSPAPSCTPSGWSAGVFQRTVMILVTWAAGLAACGRDNFRNPCGTRSGSHPRPGQQRHRVGTQSRFPCLSRRLPTAKGDVCRPPRICGAPFHLLGKNDRFPPENSGGKSFEPCRDPNPAAHAETRGAAAGPSAGAQRAMRASATRARRPPFARPRYESGLPSSCRISFRF